MPDLDGVWDRHERTEVLRIASNLTSLRGDPGNVMRHVKVLADWLDQTDGDNDRRNRFVALQRADTNRAGQVVAGVAVVTPRDDPELLVAEAETYYGFLKGA